MSIAAKLKDYSDMIAVTYYNQYNTPFKIIDIKNSGDVTIEFQDNNKVQKRTAIQNIRKRSISNPYDRTNFGVGYLGEGPYKTGKTGGWAYPSYTAWRGMLERCYSDKASVLYPAYDQCECCEEWQNYQIFTKWYYDNFYQTGTERMHVDKDIKQQGNKLYSPDTCIIVPQKINMIFASKPRRDNLPTGIEKTSIGKYHATYNGKHLGTYTSVETAQESYLKAKRQHIRDLVEWYGDELPANIQDVLLKW